MSELERLREVYKHGVSLRQTSPVDDDFDEKMYNFDSSLEVARSIIDTEVNTDINVLAKMQHTWVEDMGWHNKTVLEALALVASEVGVAVNECRMEEPSDKFGSKLADIILRTIDLSEECGVKIGDEIIKKMKLNTINGTRGRKV